jgi:hypothetical protein
MSLTAPLVFPGGSPECHRRGNANMKMSQQTWAAYLSFLNIHGTASAVDIHENDMKLNPNYACTKMINTEECEQRKTRHNTC